jgi:hypothetical protein
VCDIEPVTNRASSLLATSFLGTLVLGSLMVATLLRTTSAVPHTFGTAPASARPTLQCRDSNRIADGVFDTYAGAEWRPVDAVRLLFPNLAPEVRLRVANSYPAAAVIVGELDGRTTFEATTSRFADGRYSVTTVAWCSEALVSPSA